jgi:hypothetical protein
VGVSAETQAGVRWGQPSNPGWEEALMASKDKGGKSNKTAAASTPKEKKQAKRDKREEEARKGRVV